MALVNSPVQLMQVGDMWCKLKLTAIVNEPGKSHQKWTDIETGDDKFFTYAATTAFRVERN